ncbi:hypothetical protein [Pseudonocardia spinosispora]|uniref:hypothetical protein n=1 Tax=Pseudonocardia spinosispora TaxID=103441 RepID=UPI00040EE978|nr:hypothetical protein [Pseudonocardia spinosispora]
MHTPPPQAPPGLGEPATQFLGWRALVAGTLCPGMIVIGRRRRGGFAGEGLTGSVRVLDCSAPATLVVASVGAQ